MNGGPRVNLLGPLEVWRDGDPVAVPSGNQSVALAVLAVAAGRPVDVPTPRPTLVGMGDAYHALGREAAAREAWRAALDQYRTVDAERVEARLSGATPPPAPGPPAGA